MPNKIGKLEEPTDIMKETKINIFGLSGTKERARKVETKTRI
jgi:hypothetical protein